MANTLEFLYKRKLAVYNLTVTNLVTHKTSCYVWNQTIAKRGSNEIASCLKKYIEDLPATVRTLYLFVDNCSGQNKNRFVVEMLSILAMEKNLVINLIFLEKGHTQNVNDTVHSVMTEPKKGSTSIIHCNG